MKKIWIMMAVLVVLGATITGCNKKENEPDGGNTSIKELTLDNCNVTIERDVYAKARMTISIDEQQTGSIDFYKYDGTLAKHYTLSRALISETKAMSGRVLKYRLWSTTDISTASQSDLYGDMVAGDNGEWNVVYYPQSAAKAE